MVLEFFNATDRSYYEKVAATFENFNFEISLFLAIGSIITANITSSYVQKISAKIMGRAIGLIIVIYIINMTIKKKEF